MDVILIHSSVLKDIAYGTVIVLRYGVLYIIPGIVLSTRYLVPGMYYRGMIAEYNFFGCHVDALL